MPLTPDQQRTLRKKKWGQKIREIRKELDMTMEEFVDLFNHANPTYMKTTVPSLAKYETGHQTLAVEMYMKFMTLKKPESKIMTL